MNKESKCISSWLHNYVIVGQHPEGVLEMCTRCKNRVFFKIVEGRINNFRYIKYHNKQVLPRNHGYYAHEYSKK